MINELSIIIPTLNEEKYVGNLLTSISNQQYMEKLQVIVVDGYSTDYTIGVVEKFKNQIPDLVILKTNRGTSFQRNFGAKYAKYKYLLFLDADVILPNNFLQKALSKLNSQEQFIITSILWISESDILSYLTYLFMVPVGLLIISFDPLLSGSFILTTKENHQKIGGFREDISLCEDYDYAKRSLENGAKYHLNLYPMVLTSARRMKEMGRIKFMLTYFQFYYLIRRYGIESVGKKVNYPFGHY